MTKKLENPKQKHAPKRPWTADDLKWLEFYWGVVPVKKLSKMLNRTPIAVMHKATDAKLGGLRRGTKSLAQLARESGFAKSAIRNVASTLDLKFRRIARGGRAFKTKNMRFMAITSDQEEAILQYLRDHPEYIWHYPPGSKRSNAGAWGTGQKPPACERCQRSDKPHYAKGMCHPCHTRVSREANAFWGGKHAPACLECQGTERPYYMKNLCQACYCRVNRKSTQWGSGGLPSACRTCKRSDRAYCARGLCRSCHKLSASPAKPRASSPASSAQAPHPA